MPYFLGFHTHSFLNTHSLKFPLMLFQLCAGDGVNHIQPITASLMGLGIKNQLSVHLKFAFAMMQQHLCIIADGDSIFTV